jgi:hypothetical protein
MVTLQQTSGKMSPSIFHRRNRWFKLGADAMLAPSKPLGFQWSEIMINSKLEE